MPIPLINLANSDNFTTMQDVKTDRRVRKTQRMLRTALTTLLKEKPIREITVREISELADINRGTFYLHYRDVYDMLEQLEAEMFNNFNALLNSHSVADLERSTRPILYDIYTFLAEYNDMCTVLLGPHGDASFVARLQNVVHDKCLNDWNASNKLELSGSMFDYYYSFAVAGIVGIMGCWMKNGMKESPERMAEITEGVMKKGFAV